MRFKDFVSLGPPVAAWLALSASDPALHLARSAELPPSFDVQASAITVDVVVLDGHGQPVRGLGREDFSVLEDGRPQTIAGFEARATDERGDRAVEVPAAAVPIALTNEDPAQRPERVFALLVDDLGISALAATRVKAALADWLRRQARPRDEITITTTSGEVWWSDRVDRGREELLLALERVRGSLPPRTGGDTLSDWEAYRIAVHEASTEMMVDPADRSRPPDAAGSSRQGQQDTMYTVSRQTGSSTTARVTQRWLDTGVCPRCVDPNEMVMDCREIRLCSQRVQSRAQELHQAWLRRAAAVYASVRRLSRGLAGSPGRKAILLVSEELFEDTTLRQSARDAVDASQRANTAVYFLAARGLTGSSLFAAESPVAPRPQDVGAIGVEEGFLAMAGGVALAEDTGGVAITSSNDLGSGLTRMASDSSSYYLLGYQPEQAPDGKWHSLEVKVARPGTKVRARRRYLATTPTEAARAGLVERGGEARPQKRTYGLAAKRPLAPALLVGTVRDGLPLRLASYVQDTNGQGATRVRVVLEIDNGRVQVNRATTPWKASLDLTIMAANLGRPASLPVDERLELSLEPGQVGGGWWLVPREVWLPPGVSQIRVFVRDTASGAAGLVSERVSVPDPDQPHLSTPIITDRTLPSLRPGEPPRLVPTAQRTFGRRAQLFCQYEVFLFGAWNLPGVAQLEAGYTLQRLDGPVIALAEASPIATDGNRAVRRITLPTEKLEDGPYELTVNVHDRLTQRTLVTRQSFVVEHEAVASADPAAP